eukprot:CAMPEP_0194133804 /NCGR_PEP_ID=MMETSP0152-20130528/3819_1 /TAXON_ID=1049557 /ORGANISM="Thalassiothrix antarctica, Strain L6-D1" /LENGTH=216 /DNA_ID=CAMNT_0038829165 /DNA_START=14 /DNA_END=664 /DNA_ORIENTATION=+
MRRHVLSSLLLLITVSYTFAFSFNTKPIVQTLKDIAVGSIAAIAIATAPLPAFSETTGPRLVGEIAGSGFLFKDKLNVESFDDPKVKGVTLYISNFQKPLAERITKGDFFSDPSSASVGCARTANNIQIADNMARGKQGEEVFEESKSIMFKTLRVQRIYDEPKNTVVYVSFNTRLDKNSDTNKSRFKSSICAVNLDDKGGDIQKTLDTQKTPDTK